MNQTISFGNRQSGTRLTFIEKKVVYINITEDPYTERPSKTIEKKATKGDLIFNSFFNLRERLSAKV